MKPVHDLFVGAIAIAFGSGLILAAAFKAQALFWLPKPQLLAQTVGERAARIIIGAIGLALLVMGVLIARGWRMPW